MSKKNPLKIDLFTKKGKLRIVKQKKEKAALREKKNDEERRFHTYRTFVVVANWHFSCCRNRCL